MSCTLATPGKKGIHAFFKCYLKFVVESHSWMILSKTWRVIVPPSLENDLTDICIGGDLYVF